MTRAERRAAREAQRAPSTLTELDYLLRVNDRARQGALRFAAEANAPYLSDSARDPVPPLIELPRLLSATQRLGTDQDDDEVLALLLAPGSSLGGARPKASVLEVDGMLAIAKFPKRDEDINVVRWEALALTLASRAGIAVPHWRLIPQDNQAILLVRRFDRIDAQRVPFLSAMSMLGADDHDTRSYTEIADAIRRHGAQLRDDLAALWRRIVFNVLISNTDDHLRNHGFLYSGNDGWTLSPAYDLNPVPIDLKPRYLSTAIDEDDTRASIDLALEAAPYFELSADKARDIAREVAQCVQPWRDVAAGFRLTRVEANRMSSAFEHDDLNTALAL